MKTFKSVVATLAIAATMALTAVPTLAAPINYGDFDGTTVMYLDVEEDTNRPTEDTPDSLTEQEETEKSTPKLQEAVADGVVFR